MLQYRVPFTNIKTILFKPLARGASKILPTLLEERRQNVGEAGPERC